MKIGVIGSGVMGSAITGYIASFGFNVCLLDIADYNSADKNAKLHSAISRISSLTQPLISHPTKLANIRIGNLDDDLDLLQDCDLVIEAVVEQIQVKWELFKKIVSFLRHDCVIASNTSTFTLKLLKQQNIWSQTIVTHFFNPIKHIRLIEMVYDQSTPSSLIEKIDAFLSNDLGKIVIKCNDSPGFIANRVGCFFLEMAVNHAISLGLNIAYVDFFAHKVLLMPKTGIFGLYDLVGLDVMRFINGSLTNSLLANDQYCKIYVENSLMSDLIKKGFLGVKTQCGFYKNDGVNTFALNLVSKNYDILQKIDPETKLYEPYTNYFDYIRHKLYDYTIALIPSVADNIEQIDKVMELGFHWKIGPSQIALGDLDSFGHTLSNLKTPRINNANQNVYAKILIANNDAQLCQYQNSLIFNLKTKFNILTQDALFLLDRAIDQAVENSCKLIVFHEEQNFSAGADLKFILFHIQAKNYKAIQDFISLGQKVLQRFKYSAIPTICVAQGLALGGGCELLLHSNFLITSPMLKAGLVELGIGLIPAWGGLKEMFVRSYEKEKLLKMLSNVIYQNKTLSADYFAHDYLVKPIIVAAPENMLKHALDIDLKSFQAPSQTKSMDLWKINLFDLDISDFDAHSILIINQLQNIVNRNSISEAELLESEIELFMQLVTQNAVIEKISKILRI